MTLPTFYRTSCDGNWKPVTSAKSFMDFANDVMSNMEFQDSFDDYTEWAEYFFADGSRMYSVAEYNGFHGLTDGDGNVIEGGIMNFYDVVDFEDLKKVFDIEMTPSPFNPTRDWIKL